VHPSFVDRERVPAVYVSLNMDKLAIGLIPAEVFRPIGVLEKFMKIGSTD
jgi:hypothetical protein